MFSDTVKGVIASANLFSIVEAAKANGVELRAPICFCCSRSFHDRRGYRDATAVECEGGAQVSPLMKHLFRVTVSCEGMPPELGVQVATAIAEEFAHRQWHQNVRCTWTGDRLLLVADNDFDSHGAALADEFSKEFGCTGWTIRQWVKQAARDGAGGMEV